MFIFTFLYFCMYCTVIRGGQTAILVRWSAVRCPRTTEMRADQRTGKNSGPALADYRNGASAIPLFCNLVLFLKIFQSKEIIR
jgi:hypothetical protein